MNAMTKNVALILGTVAVAMLVKRHVLGPVVVKVPALAPVANLLTQVIP